MMLDSCCHSEWREGWGAYKYMHKSRNEAVYLKRYGRNAGPSWSWIRTWNTMSLAPLLDDEQQEQRNQHGEDELHRPRVDALMLHQNL